MYFYSLLNTSFQSTTDQEKEIAEPI